MVFLLFNLQTSESNSKDNSINDNIISRPRSRSPPPPPPPPPLLPPTQHALSFEVEVNKVVAPKQELYEQKKEKSQDRRAEREAERLRKCLPPIRDKHLTVCSSTLWLGHVPKTVSEADLSDAFGEYGTINSINVSIDYIDKNFLKKLFSYLLKNNYSQIYFI